MDILIGRWVNAKKVWCKPQLREVLGPLLDAPYNCARGLLNSPRRGRVPRTTGAVSLFVGLFSETIFFIFLE